MTAAGSAAAKRRSERARQTELPRVARRGHRRARALPSWRIRRAASATPVAVFAFDLLQIRGKDLRALPLLKRKGILIERRALANRQLAQR